MSPMSTLPTPLLNNSNIFILILIASFSLLSFKLLKLFLESFSSCVFKINLFLLSLTKSPTRKSFISLEQRGEQGVAKLMQRSKVQAFFLFPFLKMLFIPGFFP